MWAGLIGKNPKPCAGRGQIAGFKGKAKACIFILTMMGSYLRDFQSRVAKSDCSTFIVIFTCAKKFYILSKFLNILL
jgi:hypothetical protein